jgi:D-glycero-alpha-D-manno-heptose-7-phosphate kinase
MGERPPAPPLIVTRTPLRVSFAGGGTDLPSFYQRDEGAVFSSAITSYVWVVVKRHSELFFEPIRINYSKSEQVDVVDEIDNDIARECLRFLEIEPPIYVSTVGDVPASTGLGGSSAFAVGLLHALHAYRGERVSSGQLAEEACHIEIDVLGHPIGKQDQYASAFGGLNVFRFKSNGAVTVEHQQLGLSVEQQLFSSILMFWTGHQRDANSVLAEQNRRTVDEFPRLRTMRDHALELQDLVHTRQLDAKAFGRVIHDGWNLKKGLASEISNSFIDQCCEQALAAGAYGGKLCGAGAGGFLLFIAPTERHAAIRAALSHLVEFRVGHEAQGSQLVTPYIG